MLAVVGAVEYQQYEHHQQPAYQHVQAAPVLVKTQAAPAYNHEEYENGPAEYNFNYEVHDEHTGDIKSQHETRNGDRVEGYYTLIDSDGHKRIVEYTADDHHGFNANVRREPTDIKVPVPVPAPVANHHAPAQQYHAIPEHQEYHH